MVSFLNKKQDNITLEASKDSADANTYDNIAQDDVDQDGTYYDNGLQWTPAFMIQEEIMEKWQLF